MNASVKIWMMRNINYDKNCKVVCNSFFLLLSLHKDLFFIALSFEFIHNA